MPLGQPHRGWLPRPPFPDRRGKQFWTAWATCYYCTTFRRCRSMLRLYYLPS